MGTRTVAESAAIESEEKQEGERSDSSYLRRCCVHSQELLTPSKLFAALSADPLSAPRVRATEK